LRILIIIPTYNEISTLPALMEEIFPVLSDEINVLVIDDSSPDGTGQYIRHLRDKYVFLMENSTKIGLGRAYLKGLRWAVKKDYDYVITMDADGSHPTELIRKLLNLAKPDKVIIGSRYRSTFDFMKYGMWRIWLSGIVNNIYHIIFRTPFRDVTGGIKCYPVALLNKIPLTKKMPKGYFFQVEILLLLKDAGAKFEEIYFEFHERKGGKSKFSINIVMEAIIRSIRYLLS